MSILRSSEDRSQKVDPEDIIQYRHDLMLVILVVGHPLESRVQLEVVRCWLIIRAHAMTNIPNIIMSLFSEALSTQVPQETPRNNGIGLFFKY